MSVIFSRPGFAPFRVRDFSLFFMTRVQAGLAVQMINVAVGWLIYEITGSAMALGLVGLAIFIPNLLFILVAGHVADRYERRRVLIVCNVVLTLGAMGLFAGVMLKALTPGLIYILIALIGSARAFTSPAAAALLPNIVPRDMFARAVPLNSSANQVSVIVGPALGGLIYIAGPHVVFLVSSLLFIGCTVCLMAMQARPPAASKNKVNWETVTAGFRFIRSNEILLGTISLDLFAVLLGGATALMPIFAKDIFHAGPVGLGLLRSAPAVGAFLTAFALAYFAMNRKVGLRMFQSVAAFGLATIAFGLSTNIYMAMFFLACLGAADMVSIFIRSTLVQMETPDEMRGRVSAVNSIFIGASNELGEFESGTLAHFTGPVAAVVIGGVGTLGVTALWMKLFPNLRKRDRLEE
ncbi:MAG: MFS transporter [Hyphomicrobiales bacterium]|nr:MFS transporter [Hyphomicrobiales bacterium]